MSLNFDRKKIVLLGLLLLAIVIPLTAYLLNSTQDPRSRADANDTVLQFSPATGPIEPNTDFPVDITLNALTNNVTGVDISLQLSSSLEFVSYTPSTNFNSSLINTYDPSSKTLRFASVNTATNINTGDVNLGKLIIRSTGGGSLTFTRAQITSEGVDTATPVDFTNTANYLSAPNSPAKVKINFVPTSVTKEQNNTITTEVMLDTKTYDITGVDISFQLPEVLDFTEFIPSDVFNSVLINSYNSSTRTFRLASVSTSSSVITGIIKLGEFKLIGNAVGTGNISIKSSQITASSQALPVSTDITSTAAYNITQGTTTPTLSPTPQDPNAIEFTFTALLHNIGNSGDTVNPNKFEFSNKNPLNPEKPILVELISANSPTLTKNVVIKYDSAAGNFKGKVLFDGTTPSKTYQIKIKSPQYLRKNLGLHSIDPGSKLTFPTFEMVTGDINNDNALNVLDYNLLLSCLSIVPTATCTPTIKTLSDINDDGKNNDTDFNLFIRESSVRNGE